MFRITSNKGFHMSFSNGLTISVQWGAGNYCDNYDSSNYIDPAPDSSTAEIGVWGDSDLLRIAKYDTVIGRLSADEVAVWIQKVSTSKNEADFIQKYCYPERSYDE